ncbi:MAG: hypothetical protein JJT89_04690 [Nitriliruptoraceae bacterium]|nr:hypothetical protein [Nitriliruptoraceae bacterium]
MESLRRDVMRWRLVTVTAAAGWGKSTTVRTVLAAHDPAWLTLEEDDHDPQRLAQRIARAAGATDADLPDSFDPVELAARTVQAMPRSPGRPLVLDDTHTVGDAGRPLIRALAADPGRHTPLFVLSQGDLGLIDERRRVQSDVLELGAPALALDLDTVDHWVASELDRDRALAARIVAATGGWPALVQVLVDALRAIPARDRSAQVEPQLTPDRPVGRFLDRVVLPAEAATALAAIAVHALAPGVRTEQLAPLLRLDRPEAVDLLADLRCRGLLQADPLDPDRSRCSPAVAGAALGRDGPHGAHDGLADRLVEQLVADGSITLALRMLGQLDQPARAAELLSDHGTGLLRGGNLTLVLDTAATLPDERRSPTIEAMRSEALAFRGEWAAALRAFQASGHGDGPLPAAAAIQLGLIDYIRGDLDAALRAYGRLQDDPPQDTDLVALYSWRTTVHWLRGEHDDARWYGTESLRMATALGDDRSMAFAHTAMALVAVIDADRHANRAHYELAVDAARRAGDRLQETRLLTNMGSAAGEEGRYAEAIAITEEAIDLAEEQGFRVILGVARCNRSAYLLRTGAIDEAIADAERAREVFAAIGSRTIAYAYHLLGTARTERGDTSLAVQAYDQAIASAGTAGDQQALIPTYLGLARAVALTDLDRAEAASNRALELDDGGLASGEVHVTAGWVALAGGDADRARDGATTALERARHHSNPADVAEATTLLALLDDDPRPALTQARSLWADLEAPIWVARIELAIARRSDDPQEQARISWLERRLTSLGCVLDRGSVAHVLTIGAGSRRAVSIRALGTFGVEVEGRAVPTSTWGSRKARELVKVLAARNGWRATREELGHVLWPDEAYDRISNRLSVALSVTRSVLNSDDQAPALVSEGSVVALDAGAVDVDVATFARLADQGLRAARAGRDTDAVALLLNAEERYGGDLLEDEPDLAWAQDRRAELRATYLAVTRTLASLVVDEDPDLAIRLLLRLLDRDGYDEPAHLNLCLALLMAGRHGEAQRRYRLYRDRMGELDLPAVPYEQLQQDTPRDSGTGPAAEAAG